MGAYEGVLRDFLGVRVIAQMAVGHRVHLRPVAVGDLGKRILVPGKELRHQLLVRGV